MTAKVKSTQILEVIPSKVRARSDDKVKKRAAETMYHYLAHPPHLRFSNL